MKVIIPVEDKFRTNISKSISYKGNNKEIKIQMINILNLQPTQRAHRTNRNTYFMSI